MDKLALQKMAVEVRKGIVSSVHSAKAGHPGGSLSAADIFTYLYFEEMNIDPKDPKKEDRDRFVLSKGHTAPGLYSALANRGYFPVEDLLTLRHTGSYLQGHPDMKHIPGVDMSSGSLGQGLSAACGMALAGKMKQQDYRVYALCGDGEIEEGQIWEAAMFAGFRKLDNLVRDCGQQQPADRRTDRRGLLAVPDRQEVREHLISMSSTSTAMISMRSSGRLKRREPRRDMPTAIIAHTVKGKGVSYMENSVGWHGKAPNDEEYAVAMEDLRKAGEALCQK